MATPERDIVRVVKGFDFELTKEEMVAKGKDVANTYVKVGELERDLEDTKQKFKGQISTLENHASTELRKIRTGIEWREVECEEIRDYDQLLVEYVYRGEVKHTRPMSAEERQVKLKLMKPKESVDQAISDVIREETSKKTAHDASVG